MILFTLDNFKNFASSQSIYRTIKKANKYKIKTENFKLSDGGPGLLDVDFINKTKKINLKTLNSESLKISTFYRYDIKKKIAYIELSKICGVEKKKLKNNNFYNKSSFGVGLVIQNILRRNPREIIIGLGGSDAADLGIGLTNALGVNFYNRYRRNLDLRQDRWNDIKEIDLKSLKHVKDKFKKINLKILADVENPPTGKYGATQMFALQKGAKKKDLFEIEKNVLNFLHISKKLKKIKKKKYYGAAGCLPVMLSLVFNTKIYSGINFILNKSNLLSFIEKNQIKYLVIGEGKFDETSMHGKITNELIKFSIKNKIKIIAVFGQIKNKLRKYIKKRVEKVFLLSSKNYDIKKSINFNKYSKRRLQKVGKDLFLYVKKNEKI